MNEEDGLSLRGEIFRDVVEQFDRDLKYTLEKAMGIGAPECRVTLRLAADISGTDINGRIVPKIEYTISTGIPIKGKRGGNIANGLILQGDEKQGIVLKREFEQSKLF